MIKEWYSTCDVNTRDRIDESCSALDALDST